MKTFDELKQIRSYWLVRLQCDLSSKFEQLGLTVENVEAIADELESVSARALLDLINGDSNLTLKQLVELSVYFKVGFSFEFNSIANHMQEEKPKKPLFDLLEEE